MTEKKLLFAVMHLASIVFGKEAPFNVCLMEGSEIEILVDCAKTHPEMPQKVIDHWNAQMALFTGMEDAEVVLLVCKTSLDAGEALYDEFSTSHLEHKKTIDNIAVACYEKATGQKLV